MHVSLAVLFVGMVAAVIIPSVWRPGDTEFGYTLMAGVIAAVLVPTEWMRLDGVWRPPLSAFGAFVCIATLSGLPGLLIHPSAAAGTGLLFFCVLAVRNYLCLVAFPRASRIWGAAADRAVIIWLLCASLVVMLGSLRFAWVSDISAGSAARLTGEGHNWLNANTVGVYTASGIVAAVMGRFLRWPVRLTVVAVGLYVLLLTQSRTSMLAVAAAWLTNGAVLLYQHRMQRLWIAALVCALGVAILPAVIGQAGQIGQIDALLRRSQGASITSGRMELIQGAIGRIGDSAVFGYGFMSDESRFENGYLSWTLETGLVGLLAYFGLIAVVLARALRLLANRYSRAMHDLARYSIVLTAFLLAHAMGERTHAFQVAFTVSNAWAVLAGLVFVQSCRRFRPPDTVSPAYHGAYSAATPI